MTDTADLVKELSPELLAAVLCREVNKNRSGDCACARNGVSIPNYCRQMQDMGKAVHAAIAPMRYALSEAKRERDAYKSSRWHWKQTAVRFAERSNERLARADKLEAELAEVKNITAMLRDNNRELVGMLDDANNRAEAAEKVAENLGEMARQRADELIAIQAELAEAKREIERLRENHRVAVHRKRVTGEYRDDFKARAESAEASLAAAKERMALVQRCIGARMDQMTPAQRECAVNAAWWLLNDMTGIRPASEKPEFVNRAYLETCALKTAGKE